MLPVFVATTVAMHLIIVALSSPLKAGIGVERAFAAVRAIAPPLTGDRPLSGDIARVAAAIRLGDFDSGYE